MMKEVTFEMTSSQIHPASEYLCGSVGRSIGFSPTSSPGIRLLKENRRLRKVSILDVVPPAVATAAPTSSPFHLIVSKRINKVRTTSFSFRLPKIKRSTKKKIAILQDLVSLKVQLCKQLSHRSNHKKKKKKKSNHRVYKASWLISISLRRHYL